MVWTCEFCTFANQLTSSEFCAICSTKRGASKANVFAPAQGRFKLRTQRNKAHKKSSEGIDYTYESAKKRKKRVLGSGKPKTKKGKPEHQRTEKTRKKRKRKAPKESQYVGIDWDNSKKTWVATAFVDNKSVYFGSGQDEHDLAKSFRNQVEDLEDEGRALGSPKNGQRKKSRMKRRKTKKEKQESSFIGLSWDADNAKWQAKGKVDGNWILFGTEKNEHKLAARVRQQCAQLAEEGKHLDKQYGFHTGSRNHYEGRSLYFGILFQEKPKPRFTANIRVDGESMWIGQNSDQHELAKLLRKRCKEVVKEGGVLSNPLYGMRRDGLAVDNHIEEVLIPKNLNTHIENAEESDDEEETDANDLIAKFNFLSKPIREIQLEYENPLVAVIEAHELQRRKKPPPLTLKDPSFSLNGKKETCGLIHKLFEVLPPTFEKYRALLEENGFDDEVVWDVALQGTTFLERLLKHNFHGQVLFKKMKQVRRKQLKLK